MNTCTEHLEEKAADHAAANTGRAPLGSHNTATAQRHGPMAENEPGGAYTPGPIETETTTERTHEQPRRPATGTACRAANRTGSHRRYRGHHGRSDHAGRAPPPHRQAPGLCRGPGCAGGSGGKTKGHGQRYASDPASRGGCPWIWRDAFHSTQRSIRSDWVDTTAPASSASVTPAPGLDRRATQVISATCGSRALDGRPDGVEAGTGWPDCRRRISASRLGVVLRMIDLRRGGRSFCTHYQISSCLRLLCLRWGLFLHMSVKKPNRFNAGVLGFAHSDLPESGEGNA